MYRYGTQKPRNPDIYRCPGEPGEISLAVHLARMRSGYRKCVECPQRYPWPRNDDRISGEVSESADKDAPLVQDGVIQGVFHEEITSSFVNRFFTKLASGIWEQKLQQARQPTERTPKIVVAIDAQPFSPTIASLAGRALIRSGCIVLEQFRQTNPTLVFSVAELRADVGVYIFGQGNLVGWKLYHRSGKLLDGGLFADDAMAGDSAISRQSRAAGHTERCQADQAYAASFEKYLHGLRPLNVGIQSPTELVDIQLAKFMEKTPCRWTLLTNEVDDAEDHLRRAIREQQLDLALTIEPDSMGVRVYEDCGNRLSHSLLSSLLVERWAGIQSGVRCVVPTNELASYERRFAALNVLFYPAKPVELEVTRAMSRHHAHFGTCGTGRYWFDAGFICSDALLVLAQLLNLLSGHEQPLSHLARKRESDFTPL